MSKKMYFLNDFRFEEVEVPEWSGYKTMVETAEDCLTILNGKCGYDQYKNIFETLERVHNYYETQASKEGYDTIAGTIWYALCQASAIRMLYDDGKRAIKDYVLRLTKSLEGMAKGVVYEGNGCYYQGNRYFHVTDPSQDEYIYNGRTFYLWDGWHSSKSIMKERADKQFNTEE